MFFKSIPNRLQLLKTFSITVISFAFLVRLILYFFAFKYIDFSILNFIKIFFIGLFFDIGNLSYLLAFYAIYLLLIPTKFYGNLLDRFLTKFAYGFFLFVYIFSFLAEIPFWQEYQRRFNFIAVDYLLYTYEVIQNIHESFPLPLLILFIILILILSIKYASKKNAYKNTFNNSDSFKTKLIPLTILLIVFGFYHYFITNSNAEVFGTINENELAKSGMYSFFNAYKGNELNYNEFYKTLPKEEVFKILNQHIKASNDSLLYGNSIYRYTKNDSIETKPNVIFIGLESLNARFMQSFTNKDNWTPTLDSLAKESIFFTNLYATGTRTIRGIEAISLSIPPTPGRSIVKRDNNENLATIGHVFKQKGYSRTFFYGGDSHFDNMANYFSYNGFDIVDRRKLHRLEQKLPTKRTRINDDEMTFENAWAVCDQDLFNKVLKVTDEQAKNNQPFFNFVMTSSNHKPYTYPDGVVDIPSGENVIGSIKYLDKSLHEFFKKAKTKSWYKNTVFVIMSDHCGFSAGRTEINVENHHIPALITNLKNHNPIKINKLSSQIDIFPTLFGYLNWSYNNNFYGKDINKMTPKEERAFIGNHRKVGLLKKGKLMLLEAPRKHTFFNWNKEKNDISPIKSDSIFLKETISYYQSAFDLFKNDGLKIQNTSKN
ncbi:phosphoglycerol transferase MdoB-like AlkP superfamily enzyme [Lutibacter sp. Hel_I_33_5]|uniref:LTA synthase family protein n=1 Tax=Lutibacter sp. Hel_I_33_5 TaxID=1566289 RepID=UPI0011A352EF|nr:LTA synthase family protein [Lutibacter sp. Hel_I_33_5]TVZ56688.1 phosphoglycerol transferase MdoB-like AlkP superfamily enzyme [Lutibacter sp. Hel_I_33_5]